MTGSNVGWAILSFASTHTHHDAAVALYGGLSSTLAKAKTSSVRGSVRALAQSAESPGALGLAALSAQTPRSPDDGQGVRHPHRGDHHRRGASASPSASPSTSATPSASASASASPTRLPPGRRTRPCRRPAAQPYVVVGGVVLLGAGAGLIGLARRRRT